MSLNQVICYFYKRLLWKVKKITEVISEEKTEKKNGRKAVKADLFIVEQEE